MDGLHVNEAPGCDLLAGDDGCWRDLLGRAEAEEEQDDEPEREREKEGQSARQSVNGDEEQTEDSARLDTPEVRPVRRRVKGKKEPAWRVDAGPIDHRSMSLVPRLDSY